MKQKRNGLPNMITASLITVIALALFCAIIAGLWEKQILTDETINYTATGSILLAVLLGCVYLKQAEKEKWLRQAACLTGGVIILLLIVHFCIGGELAAGWYQNLLACVFGFGLSLCGSRRKKQIYRHKVRAAK